MLKKKYYFKSLKNIKSNDLWDYKVIKRLSLIDRILLIVKSISQILKIEMGSSDIWFAQFFFIN